MKLHFDKLHGAGNDFIIAGNPDETWPVNPDFIRSVCDRHKGVGADGLILIGRDSAGRLKMKYYNSDGSGAAMCGNGLRCAASFIYRHGLAGGQRKVVLLGDDGPHETEIINDSGTRVKISLLISEPFHAVDLGDGRTVYKGTVGVPHAVEIRRDLESMDVKEAGRFLRCHERFLPDGVNADFVCFSAPAQTEPVRIRTYERGVEDETLACGTGCASAGVVLHQFYGFGEKVCLLCQGKDHIEVEILKDCCMLKGVCLTGPAETVFAGEIQTETHI